MVPRSEVDAIVGKAVAEAEARLAELIQSASPKASGMADEATMNALALAISTLTDQGTGRAKRVAPEEMIRRERGHKRMMELIDDAVLASNKPLYRLRHVVYLGEMKIQPIWVDKDHIQQPTTIGWYGIPNEAMDPQNDVARAIYEQFAIWIAASEKRDLGRIKVTPGGLTIVQGPPELVGAGEAKHTGGGAPLTPTIERRGPQAGMKETHILGTIMAPAQQTA